MFKNYEIDSWQKGVLYLVTLFVLALLFFLGRKKVKFGLRVLVAMVLGLAVGLIFGQVTTIFNGAETTIIATIRPIGLLYLRLIQMVVMPLVLTAIIKSFTSLEDGGVLRRIGLRSLFWLLITTTIGAGVGILFATIPGLGNNFTPITDAATRAITPIEDVILNFFPNNIFNALTTNTILPVIVFALFVSVAVIVINKKHPERTAPFISFNNSVNAVIVQITKFIMRLTPYASFTFIAYAIGRNNLQTLQGLGLYIALIYGAMAFHFVFVQMGLLATFKINPLTFIKKFGPAMGVAFTTQSSYGTLPVTTRSLTERVGVSSKIANFIGPLSANVGMNACGGIFPAMVAVLTANAYGIPLEPIHYILILVVTTISAIGIAGVPGIAAIAATVTLSALGLPLEGIALIIAVDALVDMGRTMINVTGAGVAATIVAKQEKELDYEIFNGKVSGDVI